LGSLNHDNKTIDANKTFILAEYTVPCNGTVVAWEFCYQKANTTLTTFYPGIWKITSRSGNAQGIGNTEFTLVQSSRVTYNSSVSILNMYQCQYIYLAKTDQFIAPANSVVGLYSNNGTQLLHTNTNNSIRTHQFNGSQSIFTSTGMVHIVRYNIAIRVHLGKDLNQNNLNVKCLNLVFVLIYF